MTQICPECGAENQDAAQYCRECQASLQTLFVQDASSGGLGLAAFTPTVDEKPDAGGYPLCIDLVSRRMTHPGQKSVSNQDSLLTLEFNRISNSVGLPIGIYAVADGVGGQAAGEVASKLVIDTIAQKAQSDVFVPYLSSGTIPFVDPTVWMAETTKEANQAVYALGQDMHNDMGSTLVWALVLEDMAYIANVGDSRAYVLNDTELKQITQDHSLVGQLLADGQITPEQARVHPTRNIVYQAMGGTPQVTVDVFAVPLRIADRLLLCTDGLYSMLTDKALWQGAMSSESLSKSCDRLVREANRAGGKDNITIILVELVVN
ncbi:MAG: protein phosphatase 2C domain-containing protein [Anaerolineae bacterium]|nr:protein phosphatase 2C domain-containing protein [Anaerolineae bacterium]